MSLPDPDAIHPIAGLPRVVFLKPLLASLGEEAPANAEVGAFTQYDDPEHARAVFARNPARIMRRRRAEDAAARLVALAWWDWPAARIARAIPLLVRGGVAELEAFAATG